MISSTCTYSGYGAWQVAAHVLTSTDSFQLAGCLESQMITDNWTHTFGPVMTLSHLPHT